MDAYGQALEAGDKLLAINPANPDLLAAMAGFAAKAGQKPLAVELAARALRRARNDYAVLCWEGVRIGR